MEFVKEKFRVFKSVYSLVCTLEVFRSEGLYHKHTLIMVENTMDQGRTEKSSGERVVSTKKFEK